MRLWSSSHCIDSCWATEKNYKSYIFLLVCSVVEYVCCLKWLAAAIYGYLSCHLSAFLLGHRTQMKRCISKCMTAEMKIVILVWKGICTSMRARKRCILIDIHNVGESLWPFFWMKQQPSLNLCGSRVLNFVISLSQCYLYNLSR